MLCYVLTFLLIGSKHIDCLGLFILQSPLIQGHSQLKDRNLNARVLGMSPLFVTEPSHGSQSFGSNYPRTWDELEKFFHWLQDLPYEEQTTPKQKQIGAEAAEYFVQGFCDFWFPGYSHSPSQE